MMMILGQKYLTLRTIQEMKSYLLGKDKSELKRLETLEGKLF